MFKDVPHVAATVLCSEYSKLIDKCLARVRVVKNPPSSVFFFKRVRALLSEHMLHLIPTDKDGGFAVISDHLVKTARAQILSNGDYNFGHINHRTAMCTGGIYYNLCKEWASKLEAPGLAKKLMSSISCDKAVTFSTLELTAKTHKNPISFRNLHASTLWKYGALSKFIANVLQRELNRHSHVLKDTKALVKALSKVQCKPHYKFCKLDVKHFYMSGTSVELADLAASAFEETNLYRLVKESILFLLEHQEVVDKSSNTRVKVCRGSGMGLPHSGAIAELALLQGGEIPALKHMHDLHIVFYARFKDDILIVFSDYARLNTFINHLRRGHPFKIQCDLIDSHSVHFLEVCVEKYVRAFRTFPICKPSSLQVPWLSKFSAHVKSVLNSWPRARLFSRLSLCSHPALRDDERSAFIARARTQFLTKKSFLSLSPSKMSPVSRSKERTHMSTKWLVLPHFPALLKTGFASKTSVFWNSDFAKHELGAMSKQTQIKISWRNVLRNVSQHIKSYW